MAQTLISIWLNNGTNSHLYLAKQWHKLSPLSGLTMSQTLTSIWLNNGTNSHLYLAKQ